MYPLTKLAVLLFISFLAMMLIIYSVYKYKQRHCSDKSFWCANRLNYNICKNDNDNSSNYKNDCCVNNDDWVEMMNTQDKDPNTNGYNKNCIDN